MIKKINTDAVVEEICKEAEKGILIYGAGAYGKGFYHYLKEKYHVNVERFVVSSVEHMDSKEIEGIPVEAITKDDGCSVLVIAVSEQKQQRFLELAKERGFTKIYLLLNEFYRYIQSELNETRLEARNQLNFEVHITDHCNLNCKGCYHFSPLSKESFLSIEEFERDFKQISELCGERISRITLLGGEPLLHPRVVDFLYTARKYFKKCALDLLTNGLLLKEMQEEFWIACVKNHVSIHCTKYPIQVDYTLAEKIADTYGLHIAYHNDIGAGEKMLIKYPFDLYGTQPIAWNYAHCTRSNTCITLKHGRLFTCPMAAHAHLAKEFFDLDLELSEKDSIDIYQARSFEEIADFLVKPIPFCRYCNLQIKPEQQEWAVSSKQIEEWF